MTPAALRDLGRLMEARKARDLARLERLASEARALDAELATLAATAVADVASGEPLPPGRQAARLAWIDQRTAMVRQQRAALAPEIERARAAAVQSLGRERALDRVAETAARAEAARRTSRDEREAPSGGT
ncbi:MAG: hypothetical protein QM699_18940 [Amaricoccus sp.]|uniref:hypothetical protein n=1 Tax=Amaricoccus sp. TaxID=1872485 RepID=UPI0039E29C60